MENELLDNTTQDIEYLGYIPEGWKWVKLGEVGIVITGKTPSSKHPEDWGYDMPFVTPTDFKNYRKFAYDSERYLSSIGINRLKNKVLPENSVLVTCIGSDMGKVVVNKLPVITNQQINSIIPNRNMVTPDFLYYVLVYNYQTLRTFASNGTAIPILNKTDFENIEVLIPPLPEQKAIAEVLSSIDDKIELLHRQNKTLEEMAMTLFRQWFIEPTKDGLPDGWEERKLKDIYIFEKGIEPGSKNYLETPSDDAVRFIRVGDMLDNKANVYIKKDLAGNSICKFDDLLVSFDGTVGRVSFGLVGCYSSGIRKVYSKDEVYNKLWLKHQIFISEEIQDEINMYAEGTTILHASSSIDYLSFVFPPKEKIEEYDKFFDPIYKKILNNKTQIQTLEKLRDTLLPKLMSGEVKII